MICSSGPPSLISRDFLFCRQDFLPQRRRGAEKTNTEIIAADEDRFTGRLSRIELQKLEEVTDRYWLTDEDELSEITHQFPEWKRNEPAKGGMTPIRSEHVLEALGMADLGPKLQGDAEADVDLDALLNGAF